MDSPINVAVVGCGFWGPNLIRNFRSLADCRVRTICDVNEERLAHMEHLYPEAGTTTEYEDIVNDPNVDAITIATPVHLHFALAKKSLLGGKHTLIEKPMAASVAECQELIALAEERKLVLMVGHTFIYSTPVRKIKEIVDSGDIGEILYISSRRLNLGLFQKDINVTWDLAPHDVSIICHLVGQNPIAVNCQGKAHVVPGIEDVTNMTLDFPNGGFATIHNSWLDPYKVREMKIVGTKKMIVYDDTEQLEKIKIYDKRVERPPHYDTYADFHYSYHYGDMLCPYIKQVEPLRVQCQHFLDCVTKATKPETCGWEGLRVVQILEAASESLRMGGGRVEVNGLISAGYQAKCGQRWLGREGECREDGDRFPSNM